MAGTTRRFSSRSPFGSPPPSPAVPINVGHGQNEFLTAALLGGVLIPIALLASGRSSTIGAAAAPVATLVAVSFAMLGGGIWHTFADSMNFTQTVVLEQGGTGWQKIQSIFSAVRMWGASVPTAYAIQGSLLAMPAAKPCRAVAQRRHAGNRASVI